MARTPRITGVRARAVVAPLARPLRSAVATLEDAALVLVDVETDQGITGRAYLFAYTRETLRPLVHFIEECREFLVGQEAAPFRIQQLAAAKFRLLGRQGLVGMALSTIDQAVWDAWGQFLEQPVAACLGSTPSPIPAYDSYGAVDPDRDRAVLEASLRRGFKGIKIKVGVGSASEDREMVRGIREIIGPDVALMADFNQSQTAVSAVRRMEALAEFDLAWVEEPVPAEDHIGHARVRESAPFPIQTGENWWFPQDMAKAIEAGACDLAMPDLMKIGGITGWMQMAGLAEVASIPVSSHIFPEASAHVLAATPTAHWLEFMDLAGGILAEPIEVRDGTVTARGPGLGIAWNEAAVARYSL